MKDDGLIALINDLRKLPAETEWAEFKENNAEPERIGKTISALANAACLSGQPCAYIVWGIVDGTHEVVGTAFQPLAAKKGNESLEFWLAKALSPSFSFRFQVVAHPNGRIVLLEIPATNTVPVKFNGVPYIRIGSATPKLADFPEREADLLGKLRPFV
jgi:ATP-dependent DNA helicase RecG